MPSREVKVAIIGDAKGFGQAVSEADGHLGRLGGSFKKFAALAAGSVSVAGITAIGKGLYDAAIESQKVTKQTEAVIKSMGNVAGVSADQVAKLSEKLSMKTGVDDELIQSGQNVLLTFGKVRNEVGKGNDIFDRATKVALDMSVALGQDLKGSNIQLGKALNDPIKGISALGRVGVSFTQQQKDQVKALVESGKTLEAQKLILGEVEKQFKGSAEAQATAGDKLKVVWGNLQETLGAKLVPVVEKAAGFLADKLPGAMEWVSRTSDRVAAVVRENWPQIQKAITGAVEGVRSVVVPIVQAIQTLWDNFGNNILELVQRIWPRIQQVIEGALTIIRGIVETVTALIHGDWSGVWEGIKGIVTGAWEAIQGIVFGALEVLRSGIGVVLEVIGSIIKGVWDGIVDFIGSIPGRLVAVASGIWDFITDQLNTAKQWWLDRFDQVVGFVKGLPGRIASAAAGMWDGIKDAFRGAINWIIDKWNGLEFKVPSVGFGPFKTPGFTLGVPDIPRLHSGGVFRAPSGQTEGLALLRNNERVLTPAQSASTGGSTYIFNVNAGHADAIRVVELIEEAVKKGVSFGPATSARIRAA